MTVESSDPGPSAPKLIEELKANLPRRLPLSVVFTEENQRLRSTVRSNAEYYPFIRENEVLQRDVKDISARIPDKGIVMEIATGQQKMSQVLLAELERQQKTTDYYVIDPKPKDLVRDVQALRDHLGETTYVTCTSINGDLRDAIDLITKGSLDTVPDKRPITFLLLGSTMSLNRDEEESVRLFSQLLDASKFAGRECNFVISVDSCQDVAQVESLLFDKPTLPIREKIPLNALSTINSTLGYQAFDVSNWRGGGSYEDATVRQFARCLEAETVRIDDVQYTFEAGDRVCAFSCIKWSEVGVKKILEKAGLNIQKVWWDGTRTLGVYHASPLGYV